MINNKSDLKDWMLYEKNRYQTTHLTWFFFPISETDYIWKYQWTLRHCEYHTNCHHRIRAAFFKLLLNRLSVKLSIHIPTNTCGRGLKIMHTGPILKNGKAKCGDNLSVHINTSIVAHGATGGVPKIGDNCVIGVGAIILGDVHIANNIAVGANAVVNKSFEEENIAIAGVPAKKISNNGRLTWSGEQNYNPSK